MKKQSFLSSLKSVVREIFLNKYLVTLIFFMFVFLFVGEQNAISFVKRQVQISRMHKDLTHYRAASQDFQHKLETLKSVDSLECFAREQYLMKADNEVIYLIDE